jgi:hypothetical protein
LESNIVWQLITKEDFEGVGLVEHFMWKVKNLPPNFGIQALGLKAFREMYGNRRILVPSGFEVSGNGRLWKR